MHPEGQSQWVCGDKGDDALVEEGDSTEPKNCCKDRNRVIVREASGLHASNLPDTEVRAQARCHHPPQ